MITSIFICLSHHRFRNIVEKHRQTKDFILAHKKQTVKNMLPNSITMMRCVLCSFHTCIKLRKKFPCNSSLISHSQIIRMWRDQQFHQFCLNTFCADTFQIRRKCTDSLLRLVVNRKSQLRRKTNCTQDSKCILMKALHWITDTADDFVLHIIHSMKQIHQTSNRMICHRIDCKVSALQVLFQA